MTDEPRRRQQGLSWTTKRHLPRNVLKGSGNLHRPKFNFLQATVAWVSKVQKAQGVKGTTLLNFVVSDGFSMLATRYVYPEDQPAASLYYSEGSTFERARNEDTSMSDAAVMDTEAETEAHGADGASTARHSSVSGTSSTHQPYPKPYA